MMAITRHVCPRNCFSTCSMLAEVENGQLKKVTGDKDHPYTRGKLCAKGLSYVDQVYHPERLTYPMYQKTKGSGRFERISWEDAYGLIINEWEQIDRMYGSLLPVGLYKYTGDLSVGHYAPEEFFSSIGPTTRIVGSPCASAGFDAATYDMGGADASDPETMTEAELIVIWGANPAVTSVHSIHFLQEARRNGATIVLIDPVLTKTARLADHYIQINPGTDGLLANALALGLIRNDRHDVTFLERHTNGFERFYEALTSLTDQDVLRVTGIQEKALARLHTLLASSRRTFHWLGLGFQRHVNGGQMIRCVNALAAVNGMIGKPGAGVHYAHADTWIFTNQTAFFKEHLSEENRILPLNDWLEFGGMHLDPPLKSLWISCRNPLIQDPQPARIREYLKEIPFVVTADLFMTETAKWSNLVLPVTTFFEEEDIATSYWHRGFTYNEQAILPVGEAKSDYTIMQELAGRMAGRFTYPCTFPTGLSKRSYLNRQWNPDVRRQFGFRDVHDAFAKQSYPQTPYTAWTDRVFKTPSGNYEFDSGLARKNGLPALPVHDEATRAPQPEGMLRLLTPHDTFGLNSQFRETRTIPVQKPAVFLHPDDAKEAGIQNGSNVQVQNRHGSLLLTAALTADVAKGVALIYQRSGQTADDAVNQLVTVQSADMGEMVSGSKGIAYYDTFVEVRPVSN
ncbi:molybdopterin-dependent oxidoreductase [Salisediminibacterium selenitireducens]|uniref:Molybdopterin oxidoreductase n=1 Tax=Bacillus selenitireducens (strain ATCC 700615 / DSM 15326 / MLS10) TaxID=439292 RepID=D6Y0L9_BACIE|nr:molybdopterin-dependent oxidoreductase [Salisediminibacterium selenitireducens]ADI00587.1 molybdopterin oxidoreductase [[Bacillus] selenitireducens MLS10]